MQISSRFTLAVHILTCIKTFGDSNKITSEFLAASTNVNPVIVRKILGQLKKAGIVEVARGSGGAVLAKPEGEITFLDIYKAVDCVRYKNVYINQQELGVLEDVNLELNKGEFVYLIGKVGSGKTSLLKTIYGELDIQSGEAEVLGYNMTNIKRKHIP